MNFNPCTLTTPAGWRPSVVAWVPVVVSGFLPVSPVWTRRTAHNEPADWKTTSFDSHTHTCYLTVNTTELLSTSDTLRIFYSLVNVYFEWTYRYVSLKNDLTTVDAAYVATSKKNVTITSELAFLCWNDTKTLLFLNLMWSNRAASTTKTPGSWL